VCAHGRGDLRSNYHFLYQIHNRCQIVSDGLSRSISSSQPGTATMQAAPDDVAKALADAAAAGDAAALAGLLPPLAPAPPQAALDAALLAAAGKGEWCEIPALEHERDAAAGLLLAAGAAIDAVNADGATPLHFAAMYGTMPLIRRLLAAGARADAAEYPHRGGAMPQHHAADRGHCEALALLLDAGGQVRPLPVSAEGEGVHAGW
jgi:hypothetical protein